MEAMSPHDPCEKVICKWSSQSAKTETLLNFVGYTISHDPGPTLVIQPTADPMGKDWSKDRLAPMLRDTPCLRGKVTDSAKRNSESTIMHKVFPGGHITVGGSNSPSGLASRPIRYVLLDEVDRYEKTKEGDPQKLAEKRSRTFWNRKIVKTSSPTFAGVGIDHEYETAQQQYQWQLACLHCGERQFPTLSCFQYEPGNVDNTLVYVCHHCGAAHSQEEEFEVKGSGDYVRLKNEGEMSKAYWFNQWASPFAQWIETVTEWEDAKGDPVKEQTVVNTAFAEVYEEKAEQEIDRDALQARAEPMDQFKPAPLAVTAGVDVQGNRLEYEFVGWGPDEESWSLEYGVIDGDPTQKDVWEELTEALRTEHGGMHLAAACVDAGYLPSIVYSYVMGLRWGSIFATKGRSEAHHPLVEPRGKRAMRLRQRDPKKFRPELVGVHEAKVLMYRRLALTVPGPGYCHFPDDEEHDAEYFAQITAERLVPRMERGQRVKKWVQTRIRNEALDIRILALVALRLRLMQSRTTLEALAGDKAPAPVSSSKGPGKAPAAKPRRGRRQISGGIR